MSKKIESEKANENIPSEENKVLPINEPSITIKQQVTPGDMEVHHHPDLHPNKKNFREYFLEFLMIFLAVVMGFIAENIRENITDHAKAKEYAHSLYNDLKEDTSFLNVTINYKLWRGLKIDSLVSILSSDDVQKSVKLIYYYHSIMDGNIPFHSNDATIQQLRNSGGLRYFKNPQLYTAITKYYEGVNFYIERENENYVRVPFNLSAKIFHSDILMSMASVTPDPRDAIRMPAGSPQLLTADKQTLNEYLLYVGSQKQVNELSLMLLHIAIEKNLNELMKALQSEYNLH